MGVHAFFPISVSNKIFSTDNVKSALLKLPDRVTQITFFVADWLQVYNRVRNCSELTKVGSIIRNYSDTNKDFLNRQRWINKFLESSPHLLNASTRIIGMEQFFDSRYANTFRNINILRTVDSEFHRDVINAAHLYLNQTNKRVNKVAISLSEQYILEEIAINIRIRVMEKLEEEYYLGHFHVPMLKIYANLYSASVQDLLGVKMQECLSFRFYSLQNMTNISWLQEFPK